MALFGKRFQRTISMSQISPGSNLYAEKAQAHPGISPAEAAQKTSPVGAGRPLVLHDPQQLLQAATNQWEALRASCSLQQDDHHGHHQNSAAAKQWEAMKVSCNGVQEDHHQQPTAAGVDQWEILKSAEAMMMMIMGGQSSSTQEEPGVDDQAMATQNDPHLQMGLWPHLIINPSVPPPPHSPSFSGLIPRVDFLDSCFYCKRRLRHERDIFIYRGDAAFCTEECRQRQILSDETGSQRASKKGGGGATSETAMAA